MTADDVNAILMFLSLYALAGLIFAVPFTLWGAAAMDHGTEGTGFAFRLIIVPGVIAFWPWLLARWLFGLRFKG